jgi:hypothetical protein
MIVSVGSYLAYTFPCPASPAAMRLRATRENAHSHRFRQECALAVIYRFTMELAQIIGRKICVLSTLSVPFTKVIA